MNPGDRIILVPRLIQPGYLGGVRGTLIRRQPGEHRALVKLDNDPQARKYAGGEWCVPWTTIAPDDHAEGIWKVIAEEMNPACQESARNWIFDIARIVDQQAASWVESRGAVAAIANSADHWHNVVKPALLWRFYAQLSRVLGEIAEGHEEVLRRGLEEER